VSPVFNIPHKQTEPSMSQADPYYVMLSTMSNDAICISVISVMGQKIQGTFFGDTGYMCGMSWFPSDNAIGSDYSKPRCAWLDADHSAQINARAVSFHLNDMQPEPQKLAQYDENQDTLCKSSPRFSFWGNLLPDGVPPFFNPPLKYTGDNGADVDITKVLDDPENPVDKGKFLRRRRTANARRSQQRGSNHDTTRLIISDQNDNVREVCEHPNSYGWDIVSSKQGLFCCMEHKQLYPLCSASVTNKCFDLDVKTLRGGSDIHVEEANHMRFGRLYNTTTHWKDPQPAMK
jgi:hypothetical protein